MVTKRIPFGAGPEQARPYHRADQAGEEADGDLRHRASQDQAGDAPPLRPRAMRSPSSGVR